MYPLRGILTSGSYTLIMLKIIFFFRDNDGSSNKFQAVAVISHHGQMTADGEGRGHYTCDVKTTSGHWYRTNDNEPPVKISNKNLSKKCAVVLYSKIVR